MNIAIWCLNFYVAGTKIPERTIRRRKDLLWWLVIDLNNSIPSYLAPGTWVEQSLWQMGTDHFMEVGNKGKITENDARAEQCCQRHISPVLLPPADLYLWHINTAIILLSHAGMNPFIERDRVIWVSQSETPEEHLSNLQSPS